MRTKAPLKLSDGSVINRREDRVHVDPEHKSSVAKEVAQAIREITWKYADEEDRGLDLCPGCSMITIVLTFLELFKNEKDIARMAMELGDSFHGLAMDISRFGIDNIRGALLDDLRKVKVMEEA